MINEQTLQVILGSILGDGYLRKNKKSICFAKANIVIHCLANVNHSFHYAEINECAEICYQQRKN